MARRVYSAVRVKAVSLQSLLSTLSEGAVWVGADIGKQEIAAIAHDSNGRFSKVWKTRQPGELRELVALLAELTKHRPLRVAMESTGTYGDAFRQALADAGIEVHRVSGKAVHDYAEVFDGVPSNHDGKDAAIIAELAALGKTRRWPLSPRADRESQMMHVVYWLDMQQRVQQMWLGRLEGLLARHWPEVTQLLKLPSLTLQRMLACYGGPARLAEDGQAAVQLRRWGGRFLTDEKLAAVMVSAQTTVGVRMTEHDRRSMQCYAQESLRAGREIREAMRTLRQLAQEDEELTRLAEVVGAVTACVIHVGLGCVREYTSGGAYRKAFGLNLKERSSGKYRGQLKLTKRGPALARRWLFFAAMRILQQPAVRPWFEAKKARDGNRGMKAVVSVMRKLTLALYAVGARGETFDATRLFPGRRAIRQRLEHSPVKRASHEDKAAGPPLRLEQKGPPHTASALASASQGLRPREAKADARATAEGARESSFEGR